MPPERSVHIRGRPRPVWAYNPTARHAVVELEVREYVGGEWHVYHRFIGRVYAHEVAEGGHIRYRHTIEAGGEVFPVVSLAVEELVERAQPWAEGDWSARPRD